jgi:hypothetical protein
MDVPQSQGAYLFQGWNPMSHRHKSSMAALKAFISSGRDRNYFTDAMKIPHFWNKSSLLTH